MAKRYKNCMNYLVYRKYEIGLVLIAQFDKEEDAKVFIECKTKRADVILELLKNDGWCVID